MSIEPKYVTVSDGGPVAGGRRHAVELYGTPAALSPKKMRASLIRRVPVAVDFISLDGENFMRARRRLFGRLCVESAVDRQACAGYETRFGAGKVGDHRRDLVGGAVARHSHKLLS